MIRALALMLLATPAAASQWNLVPAQSSLSFAPEWNGQALDGRFPKFSASIRFDPAKLTEAKVDAVIDLAAATTPDKTVNASLPTADWFDVKKSPTARFTSSSITQVKRGQYLARGTLTMRGLAVPVALPFTLAIKGDTATMQGQAVLDRRSFKIGNDSDASGTWVGFKVPVKVRITATRQK
ncbi:YceI family protein [Sandaracinobacteroides hominis]|uniref:YceI family protein n=1 Tax=Sandaracinobacteroides hominis TaxID=2780086 RepID=UPI0018F71073|nr:YceI family protein [Sandaracinobacteroides hominis]